MMVKQKKKEQKNNWNMKLPLQLAGVLQDLADRNLPSKRRIIGD